MIRQFIRHHNMSMKPLYNGAIYAVHAINAEQRQKLDQAAGLEPLARL